MKNNKLRKIRITKNDIQHIYDNNEICEQAYMRKLIKKTDR